MHQAYMLNPIRFTIPITNISIYRIEHAPWHEVMILMAKPTDLFSFLATDTYEPTKYGSGSSSSESDTVRESDSAPSEYPSRSSNSDPGREANVILNLFSFKIILFFWFSHSSLQWCGSYSDPESQNLMNEDLDPNAEPGQ